MSAVSPDPIAWSQVESPRFRRADVALRTEQEADQLVADWCVEGDREGLDRLSRWWLSLIQTSGSSRPEDWMVYRLLLRRAEILKKARH